MNNIKFWFDNVLKKDLLYKMNMRSSFDIPKIDSINLNIYSKALIENPKLIAYNMALLKILTSQKPTVCRAKKSVAAFKIRKNMIIGSKVKLRNSIAFDFLNNFVLLAIAKLKKHKFYTVSKQGNVSIGLDNMFIFPQLTKHYEKFPANLSCIINISFLNSSHEFSKLILRGFQLPIK